MKDKGMNLNVKDSLKDMLLFLCMYCLYTNHVIFCQLGAVFELRIGTLTVRGRDFSVGSLQNTSKDISVQGNTISCHLVFWPSGGI